MTEEKHIADLIAGFGSFKFIPMPIVISTNNANPKLILYDDHIEYRGGFTTSEVRYEDIEQVGAYIGWQTNNITISKKKRLSTFIGNFRTHDQLREFLTIFKSKGCSLTYKAQAEMDK